jgi:hypothetical protein
MKASDITLHDIRRIASNIVDLNLAISFIQVEWGLSDLEACWDGFSDSANHFNQTFNDERDCALQFGLALNDYAEYSEFAAEQVG